MRSGRCAQCTPEQRSDQHHRCTLLSCSSACHLIDTREAAAALEENPHRSPWPPKALADHWAEQREQTFPTLQTTVEQTMAGETLTDEDLEQSPLLHAIGWMVAAAQRLDEATKELPDPEESLRLLWLLRQAIGRAKDADSILVRHIYLTGEHGEVNIEGFPPAKVTRARNRKSWDERGIARAVIDARMTERGFEVPDDPWEVAEWLLEVFGVSYARVTPLRAMHLDPADFCEETPGSLSVQFVE